MALLSEFEAATSGQLNREFTANFPDLADLFKLLQAYTHTHTHTMLPIQEVIRSAKMVGTKNKQT